MVSFDNIYVIGLFYMDAHNGYKPSPQAFVHFIKDKGFLAKKIFFLGNRLVDMELADNIKKELSCEIKKCLIIRNEKSIAVKDADLVVHNLKQVSKEIKKFKPDIIFSDFDNTLSFTGYDFIEEAVEITHFWERHGNNKVLRIINNLFSLIISPFIKRRPFVSKDDNTELFIKTLKVPLVIHSMSPEFAVKSFLKEILE